MSNVQEDGDLVRQARTGKREAFNELMRRYQQRVYWTARRIVGNHDDADDVAQETFVKAFLALDGFREESSFFTWLYRIAVNLSLNTVRKRQLKDYLSESLLLNRLLPSRENPEDQAIMNETEERLREAIAELPERQKAVFVMRFFDGMTYEEISEVLKTSVGGLKANYFHALKKVQRHMSDEA